MKKVYLIGGLIIILVIILARSCDFSYSKTIDWEESFNEKSNKPYGLRVFYKELALIFKDKKIRTLYHQPASYFYANSEDGYGDHIAKGTYIKIGNSNALTYDSVDELLYFAEHGNTLFISDYYFPQILVDTLGIDIDYVPNEKDSISKLVFESKNLSEKNTKIDRSIGDYYFGVMPPSSHQVLGYADEEKTKPNFIKVPFEDGTIYLHLQPKIFTNYNVLKDDNYSYVEEVLSFFPDEDIYFDSFYKYQTAYSNEAEESSDLGWFLEQRAFRWAWYLALILIFLFVIFIAKRRQRIIKVVKPLENTTVAFVKTISNLYFETQDHKNIIEKKSTYFLERIRTQYNLDTSKLDEEFIERLSLKSGVKKEKVKTLINYIDWLRNKRQYFESNLIQLNTYIEEFYSE
ncbi:DUF4350 domain-containing protein [Aureisphaera sp. CAU 1614]|uniref:DUF4350 domain-containing protein n=1 Tax=Halomarinibacterium sedimenti TaxID=2857106 RepID=A0A9X1JVX7_9FLAO|nr:DUF4350 domain-containing protein [Halomarinibacterium sedimenti]MBW2938255.1 DUF4350 domain-containing protein [Halomarinibacterium sedimenti]